MYYTKQLKYVKLEYSDKDLAYINELTDRFAAASEEIVSFFGIEPFGRKVDVKLFDSLRDFRAAMKAFGLPTDKRGRIDPWICGLAQDGAIYTLCLKEFRKAKGHRKETEEDLMRLILHEFVHECHRKAAGKIDCYVWLSEGLATALSHQFDGKKTRLNASVEEMRTGRGKYEAYYTMFQYVYRAYGKDYILQLVRDNNRLAEDTPRLYEEAKRKTETP